MSAIRWRVIIISLALAGFSADLAADVRINSRPGLNYGTQSLPYSDQLYAGGGTAPYTFALTAGSSLPAGLNLSASGLIAGTPTTSGTFNFSITVTDAGNHTSSTSFNLTLCSQAWAFTGASTLPQGAVGQLYSPTTAQQITVAGACGATLGEPFLSLVSGTMPPGLRLPYTGIPAGLYGTPTAAGTFTFTLKALEWVPNGRAATRQFTVTISPLQTLTITSTSFTTRLGSDYAQVLPASGGYLPYIWSTPGPLPPGIILSAGGSLEGQPTQASGLGTPYSFPVTVTDGRGKTATAKINLAVNDNPPGLVITSNPLLPAGYTNIAYSKQLGAAGRNNFTVTWSIVNGSLPRGLILNSATGVISGTVTGAPGAYNFTVQANARTDGNSTQNATINVFSQPLTLDSLNIFLPGTIEFPYFIKSGGTVVYNGTLDLWSGSLPPGVTTANFSENGFQFSLIEGTPNALTRSLVSYSGIVRLKLADGRIGTAPVLAEVSAPAPMNSKDLPGGALPNLILGADYGGYVSILPGGDFNFPNSFSVTAGSLPPGISLESDNQNLNPYPPDAFIYGTPTASGTYQFTVTVTDPAGGTTSAPYTITVLPFLNAPLQLSPPTIPPATLGSPYSQQITAINGGAPYTFAIASGQLPQGITLLPSGLLSGTPNASAGNYVFQVKVTDNTSPVDGGPLTATISYTLTVNPASPLVISPTSLPDATRGANYNVPLSASGGVAPYTFKVTGLPPGLSFHAASSSITGLCTGQSQNGVTIQVTDSSSNSASEGPLSLGCNPAPQITNATPLPNGVVNSPYSVAFTTNALFHPPGAAPFTWSLSNSTLPAGLSFNTATGVLSGTPASAASAHLTVTFTDRWGATTSKVFTVTFVTQLRITTTSPLPAATVNVAYRETFAATGGTGGYSFSATGLPAWLSLAANGNLTGRPPGAGTVTFTVKVTDSSNNSTSQLFSLPVNAGLLITTSSPLPPATVGAPYSVQFAASGGSGTYVWTASGLPAWLTLSSAGLLTGTPPSAASATFNVKVTDSLNDSANANFTLPVDAKLTIGNKSPLAPATVGMAYSLQFSASGGSGNNSWSATGLPAWLTLSPAGLLTGTPPSPGPITFTVKVTDSAQHVATRGFTLPVNAVLTIGVTSPLPPATAGLPYSLQFTASGGSGVYSWAASGLPAWLTLTPSGLLTGTPPNAVSATFRVTVTDSAKATAKANFTLPVNATLTIQNVSPLPPATAGLPYALQFTASGGSGGYSWTATGLPAWLTLSGAGLLAGTPPVAGPVSFSVMVTDSNSDTASGTFILPVFSTLTITSSPTPATAGSPYSFLLTASGGTGDYTWSSTNLPAWLALSSTGLLTGTPPAAGPVSFNVSVIDSAENSASASITLQVNAALTITTTSPLSPATVGVPYSLQFTASGGSGSYTWTGTGLPDWLTLSASGLLSGTPPTSDTVNFEVTLTDSDGNSSTALFSLPVVPNHNPSLIISLNSPLPAATVGVPYSLQFVATGGSGLVWSATGLPSWLSLSATGLLTGTPPAPGSFTFNVTVTDSIERSVSKAFTLPVSSGVSLRFAVTTLPACTVDSPCNDLLTAAGGVAPYSFSLAQPQEIGDGLSLSPNGVITGTPPLPATVTFRASVTDATLTTITGTFTIQITGGLTITTQTLPPALAGIAYSATLQVSGGNPPFVWSIVSGSLPAGLSLNPSTGEITGVPAASGSFSFSVQVSSGAQLSQVAPLTISVSSPLPVTITSPLRLPVASAGVPYSFQLSAIGGTGGYTWALSDGVLPAGLTLAANGLISGTPTTPQDSSFTIAVADSAGQTAAAQFFLTVIDPTVGNIITTTPLPDAIVGQPYGYAIAVKGGTPPYMWSISQGTIPDGLTFDSSSGNFSGTPTTPGSYSFSVTVSQSSSPGVPGLNPTPATATRNYTIRVVSVTDFHIESASTLPDGTLAAPYSTSLTAINGSSPYTWQLQAGTWPDGISLYATGVVSGTPTASGSFLVVVQAIDQSSQVATAAFYLNVANPAAPAINVTSNLASGAIDTPYSASLGATGGRLPYTWSIASGALPDGLSLNASSGAIAGTPTRRGSYTFTAAVTDAAGVQGTQAFTITILASGLTITTATILPNGSINIPYTYGLTVAGGTQPYNWSLSSGGLGSNFSIDPQSGVLSGTPSQAGPLEFVITVTDSDFNRAAHSFSLTVVSTPVSISSPPTLTANAGVAYTVTLSAAQGTPPYSWSILSGSLPSGLVLNGQSGTISGTPTVPGTSSFTVQVMDAAGSAAQLAITFAVNTAVLTITTSSPLPAAHAGVAYSQTLGASGGVGAISWAATEIPAGLSLASGTGVLSGIPALSGDFTFTVTATDSSGAHATQTYQLHVGSPAVPVVTIGALAPTIAAGSQPVVSIDLASAYSLPISINATLQITPNLNDNTDLLFANGSRTGHFTIPANTTHFTFTFQAGTLAGSIQLALTFSAAGTDITPVPAPVLSTQIAAAAPVITSFSVTPVSGGFQVVINGISTTRDMKTAAFQFTPAAGATLQTTSSTVDVSSMFAQWYQSSSSFALGSQFSLTIPFTVAGDVTSIASVSVTLTNSAGTSTAATANVP